MAMVLGSVGLRLVHPLLQSKRTNIQQCMQQQYPSYMRAYFLLLLFCILTVQQKTVITLPAWQFNIEGDSSIYNTTVPSTFADDLIRAGLVSSDPYFRDNFLQYYHYETKNVRYFTFFNAPQECRSGRTELVFEGLDTHCKVYLNGDLILEAHNMYRRFVVPVQNLKSLNNLTVVFSSSANWDVAKQKQFKDQFGFELPANYSFTRKAAYQQGWDWGPRILTVGIWKQVSLQCQVSQQIDYLKVQLLTPITSLSPNEILFQINASLLNLMPDRAYNLSVSISRKGQKICTRASTPDTKFNSTSATFTFTVAATECEKNLSSWVWSTWDLGTPNLLNLTLTVAETTTGYTVEKAIQAGLRTVTVKQDKDGFGTSFTINLNGYDLFMRGGNYIPTNMSMTRPPRQLYERIREQALFARFNMIRVWGGGQYEHDDFYRTMDEAGILIWHDLMFACALYPVMPGSDDLDNIRAEISDNLKRIGHHPSIGLWNGNNEVWIGWQEWGWQRNLTTAQKQQAEHMYAQIFSQVIPETIAQITPQIFYWQTSPSSSSNSLSTLGSGDVHFWRVWGGGTPIEEYKQYVGRFNSEYGMQSMPEIASIYKFTAPSDRAINSYVLRLHERHPLGDTYLPMYVSQYAGNTSDLRRYAFFSQVMQAYALETAITALRSRKPFCMGSLYWQLNDVWPVASWATVDYYGKYKIAHYQIRDLYSQFKVFVLDFGEVRAVNDFNRKFGVFARAKIMDYNGTILGEYQNEKTISAFENMVVLKLSNNLTEAQKRRSFMLVESTGPETGETYSSIYHYVKPVSRAIVDPQLRMVALNNNQIKVSTKSLATYVWVRHKSTEISQNLPLNYITILPGREVVLDVSPYSASNVEVTCYETERLAALEETDKAKVDAGRNERIVQE